jgi:hypothetical protein
MVLLEYLDCFSGSSGFKDGAIQSLQRRADQPPNHWLIINHQDRMRLLAQVSSGEIRSALLTSSAKSTE